MQITSQGWSHIGQLDDNQNALIKSGYIFIMSQIEGETKSYYSVKPPLCLISPAEEGWMSNVSQKSVSQTPADDA